MSFSDLLPETPGLLPQWQLLVSGMAFFNCAQNLITLKLTRLVYAGKPSEGSLLFYEGRCIILISARYTVTALQSRTFAIWTFLSAVIRLYCAYHINEKSIYDVTLWSYVAALFHFGSEWLVFRSARFNSGLLGPMIVAPVSLFWMVKQYDYYVTK